jgi:hypothetical protein
MARYDLLTIALKRTLSAVRSVFGLGELGVKFSFLTARNWNRALLASVVLAAGVGLIVPLARADEPEPPKVEKAKPKPKKKASRPVAPRNAMDSYEQQLKKEEEARNADPAWKPSHKETAVIKVNEGARQQATLNNFCLNADGNVLACCSGQKNEIRVFSPEGKLVKSWPLEFRPEAICVADDSTVIVAGVGHIAKLDQEGKVLLAAASPQMSELPKLPPLPDKTKKPPKEDDAAKEAKKKKVEELQAKLTKIQEEMQKVREECIKEAAEEMGVKTKDLTQQKIMEALREKFEKLPADKQEAIQKKFQNKLTASMEKLTAVQQELQEATVSPEQLAMQRRAEIERSATITGVAVSKGDVFVACSMTKGYGYAIWRINRDFAEPKRIIEGLRGCCGQMDVQAKDGEVWIPHNAAHKVEHYDRDGKKLLSFGKTDRKAADGFGGCCEPKNLRFGPGGEVFASESGPPVVIKRFTPKGKFLGVVGVPKYQSGCVRVSIDMAPDGKTVYIMDPGGNAIHVLKEKPAEPEKKAEPPKDATAPE